MKKKIFIALVIFVAGCAAYKPVVWIETEPSAATISLNGKTYTSPAFIPLTAKQPNSLHIEKDGYEPKDFFVEGREELPKVMVKLEKTYSLAEKLKILQEARKSPEDRQSSQ